MLTLAWIWAAAAAAQWPQDAAAPDPAPPVAVNGPELPSLPDLPQAPSPVADSDVREFIAVAARKQVGKPAYGGIGPVDKLMVIARGRGDFPEVMGSAGVPERQQLMPPPDGSVAMVRFRQSRDAVRPGPAAQDMDYVAAHKIPLFVIGEWNRSAPMWEVAWTGQHVQYRSIGDVGEIGPWHD
jgi:hypothetical protein